MIIFSDSSDPISNSTDPNRVLKTPLKKPCLFHSNPILGNERMEQYNIRKTLTRLCCSVSCRFPHMNVFD